MTNRDLKVLIGSICMCVGLIGVNHFHNDSFYFLVGFGVGWLLRTFWVEWNKEKE